MEVGETALHRWIEQLDVERQGITPEEPALTPEQQRIQALEKQVKRLELEKEILKKATTPSNLAEAKESISRTCWDITTNIDSINLMMACDRCRQSNLLSRCPETLDHYKVRLQINQ